MTTELHVVFGTGPLGKWTARTLIGLGKQVRMVNRSGKGVDLPPEAELVRGDAYDPAFTREVTRGATSVYQCAQPHYNQWPELFPPLQAAILEGAAANGARLIVGENLYMYGETGGKPLTETTPYAAHTRKGRTRQAMTETLFAAHRAGTVQVATGRGSDFFGPDDPNYTRLWFQPALQGKPINMLGRLDMPHIFTYVPDFGRALAILGTQPEALGRAWHIPSPPPVTQGEIVDVIAQTIGKSVKPMMAGAFLLNLIGLFNPILREMPEMLYEWNQPFVMDSSAFQQTFGMQPTPIRDMVRETIEWTRSNASAVLAAHA